MKKNIILFLFVSVNFFLIPKPVDLNTASFDEIKNLPISEQQAEDIYFFRYYNHFFKSIYDLREIPSIDQKTLIALKPVVMISHYDDKDETAQRREDIYYLIERLGSNEGLQEGISDVWENYLMTPRNVNKLNYSGVLNMPNVSPIDASAVLTRRARGDTIANYRDLRKTPGISHYGATNLKNYVYYSEDKSIQKKLFFDYQLKYDDSEYEEDAESMFKETMVNYDLSGNMEAPRRKDQSFWGYFKMDEYSPSVMNKFRVRSTDNWQAGLIFNSHKGEQNIFKYDQYRIFDDGKFYLGYENSALKNSYFKYYIGNYRATFGEGLVMENSDFYNSRKTGYGFSKRITGIIGDLSRTQEYALKGSAFEWITPHFNAALFYSYDKKDAVVFDSNNDGLIDDNDDLFSYLTMTRRFTNEEMIDAEDHFNNYSWEDNNGAIQNNDFRITMAPRKDIFTEELKGAHLEYSPFIGTHIGLTGYEALYNKDFVIADPDTLKYLLIRTDADSEEKYKLNDSEIANMYSTRTDEYERNYRRVIGFDWRTVLNNTSIQGEYAELSVTGNEFQIGDDPKALIISSYTQFEDLYLLTLYRDYDLGFDNPYARGFSEHEKFDDTALDKYAYTLDNPLLADLYLNSPQAQAERGIYFETRYKISRSLLLNRSYLDIWERKSDARKSLRFQGELDFRPIYQLSMRLKYKHQINRYDDDADKNVSKTDETTGKIIAYLSNFDKLSFEYRYNKVWFPPYPYLSNDEYPHTPGEYENDTAAQGTSLIHGDYINVDYTHNFNKNLKVVGSFIFWDGHGISHWDWEDMEIDFMGEKGLKLWFSIHDRIANNLFLTIKYKIKKYKTKEMEWRAWWNEPSEDIGEDYFRRVEKIENSIRLQLDWKF
ncbi:MAG: helix-hairpin-helix domain-containing protein [Candidatus Cloacimonetes bacterium]|nr:helix-hairpin-helix domain-containing protein [Candidatus Cloacimonadota bacterium]